MSEKTKRYVILRTTPTPILKARKETVFRVDAYDLNDFVKQVTGKEYESQCYLEGGHDSNHRFSVDKWKEDSDLDNFYVKEWEEFRADGKDPSVQVILDGLCSEGFIEEGVYLIEVL